MKSKISHPGAWVLLALCALSLSSCGESGPGSDPYGVNSPGYYGSDTEGMRHNLIRPGTLDREL